jgi:hypothetical protein
VILKIKVLDWGPLSDFLDLLLDRPSQLAVDLAIQALKDIGALHPDGMFRCVKNFLFNLFKN